MNAVLLTVEQVASDPDIPVMIYGESGTGKEMAARAIHIRSPRSGSPFVAVNCAALPEELLESELFGYRKGAFTGAHRDKKGYFQAAHQGTLFLDEVSEMSPRMQAKLLRVLQERTVQPVGGTSPSAIDVRVIGASNQDLKTMIEQGTFREDLFYRLNVMELMMPPLRERREDIPVLIDHFMQKYAKAESSTIHFSNESLDQLMSCEWPGNIRELENLIRRLMLTHNGQSVSSEDLPAPYKRTGEGDSAPWTEGLIEEPFKVALKIVTEKFERDYLAYHLEKHRRNVSKTAEAIGLSRVALHKKMNLYGVLEDQQKR
jgi:transcriptional regulator with PAS, ATPase and Fis domain